MDGCPICKGITGYTYTLKVGMQGDWGELPETNDITESPVAAKCLDCGRRINRQEATGVK